jgi:hypothetical protein
MPAGSSPTADQAPANEPVVYPYLVGSMPAGRPALLVTRPAGAFAVTSGRARRAIASNRDHSTISHPASCSDTVVAGQGIAAIRVVEGVGHLGPVIRVRAVLAALSERVHPT